MSNKFIYIIYNLQKKYELFDKSRRVVVLLPEEPTFCPRERVALRPLQRPRLFSLSQTAYKATATGLAVSPVLVKNANQLGKRPTSGHGELFSVSRCVEKLGRCERCEGEVDLVEK